MKNFIKMVLTGFIGVATVATAMIPSYTPGKYMTPVLYGTSGVLKTSPELRIVTMNYSPVDERAIDYFGRSWVLAPVEETFSDKLVNGTVSAVKYAAAGTLGMSVGRQYQIAHEHGLAALYKHADSWPMFFYGIGCDVVGFVKENAKALGNATKAQAKTICSAVKKSAQNAGAATGGYVKRGLSSAKEGVKNRVILAKNSVKDAASSAKTSVISAALAAKQGALRKASSVYGCAKNSVKQVYADHRTACLVAGGVVAAIAVAYAAKRAYALLPVTKEEQSVDHNTSAASAVE